MKQSKMLTEESREEVVRSNLNYSRSKQLWSFSKRQRFQDVKTECPNAFYQKHVSTISNKKVSFASSKRRVFTQVTDSPLVGTYNIEGSPDRRAPLFGASRQKCQNNSYIPQQLLRHPGPADYRNSSSQKKMKSGFSMRPKTANHRNYFVQDKEKSEVPSPFDYNPITIKGDGKTSSSKLHSSILGWAGLMKKSPRFQDNPLAQNPGPSSYSPNKIHLKSKSLGGCIGSSMRQSFIDKIRKCDFGPGPGNYQLPSQFGHYRKISSTASNKMLFRT